MVALLDLAPCPNGICWYSGRIGSSTLILFSNGCDQIELSSQPCTDIISKQQTEEQHAGRLSWTHGQECGKRETGPSWDYKRLTAEVEKVAGSLNWVKVSCCKKNKSSIPGMSFAQVLNSAEYHLKVQAERRICPCTTAELINTDAWINNLSG